MSINTFIQAIANGGSMSMSNGYDVQFDLPSTLKTYLKTSCDIEDDSTGPMSVIKLLCDEAQLPNVQSATGQLQGRYLGENQVNYPYAKFYTDLSLSWMCDVNMTPLKFVTGWHHYIFDANWNDAPKRNKGNTLTQIRTEQPNEFNRPIRLNYPSSYMGKIRITKADKGPLGATSRPGMSYILEDAFPYSVDTVPLSYGTSQITKVSANFYYAKHTVVYQDHTRTTDLDYVKGVELSQENIKEGDTLASETFS